MKKVLFALVVLVLGTDLLMAENPPRVVGDVAMREMNVSAPAWIRELGHVGMHNGNGNMLEVSSDRDTIHTREISTFTGSSLDYYGTRYGKGSTSQRHRGIRAGYAQSDFNPKYTWMPWYTSGKWTYRWKWSWRKGFYKKWEKGTARFRCDSFVNYCYTVATGRGLVERQEQTTPLRVWESLPYTR